ncbi:MAG: hypothetical protein AB8B69_26685 [Chitinophagales bacterium]
MHLKYTFLFLLSFTCSKSTHLFAQEQDGSKRYLEIAERRSIPPKMRTDIKHTIFHTSRYLYRTYQIQDGVDTVFEETKYREAGRRGKHIEHYFEGEGVTHFESYKKNAKITGWAKVGKVYCALYFVGSMLNAINPGDVDFVQRDRRRAVVYAGLTVGAELLVEKHSKLEREYLDKAVLSYNGLSQTSMNVPSKWNLGFRYNPALKTPMIGIVFSY